MITVSDEFSSELEANRLCNQLSIISIWPSAAVLANGPYNKHYLAIRKLLLCPSDTLSGCLDSLLNL